MTWKRTILGIGMPMIAVVLFISEVKAEQISSVVAAQSPSLCTG